MKAITPNTTTKSPMLAKNWDNTTRPDGWWMSEKLDGVRAIWDGENFRSRGGNIFHAPAWFKAGLPALPLDGELFVGRGKFNDAVSIVRSMTADWTPVRYLVFDLQAEGPTEDRQRMLLGLQLPAHVRIVEQVLCQSRDALHEFERDILNAKGEGVMLRAPRSPYEFKRSGHLRKLKRFIDDEATVIGHQDGEGKHEGRLGALVCQLRDGKTFRAGSGFTDEQRENPPAIGAIVTVRYFELTPDGVPRFPTFLAVRNYE
jgi:DNA ligase-1